MRDYSLTMERQPKICRVCLLEHDDEIHAATLSIRDWFHAQVVRNFYFDCETAASDSQEEVLAVVMA